MDYSPLISDKIFGEKKIKPAEKLKNGVLGPPQAKFFWGQKPIMDYSPLITDRFLIRGE